MHDPQTCDNCKKHANDCEGSVLPLSVTHEADEWPVIHYLCARCYHMGRARPEVA